VGRPWHEVINRPAIHHASDLELARAIAVAEDILQTPDILPVLNTESLRLRERTARQAVLF